jgi:hypothetical protein
VRRDAGALQISEAPLILVQAGNPAPRAGPAPFAQALAKVVIAGLDPAIHRLRKNFFAKEMDARVEPAHDETSQSDGDPLHSAAFPGQWEPALLQDPAPRDRRGEIPGA